MQIEFKYLLYKNFLSVGATTIKIDLKRPTVTLVVGKNGDGKSTMVEAFYFAITGKPFRDINKPQLVNNRNKKDCYVELGFNVGSNEFRVERGIKPAIFRIFKNGKLVEQDGRSLDYQDYLTKQVLGLDDKALRQIVILGNANYVPFMKLDAAERRKFIEELLDISIFSRMRDVLKRKIDTTKQRLQLIDYEVSLCDEKITLQQETISREENRSAERTAQLQEKRADVDNQIATCRATENDIASEMEELRRTLDHNASIAARVDGLKPFVATMEAKIASVRERISFYSDASTCPECRQPLDADHRSSAIEALQIELDDKLSKLDKMRSRIAELSGGIVEGADHSFSETRRAFGENKAKLDMLVSRLAEIDDELSSADTSAVEDAMRKVVELQAERAAKVEERGNLLHEKEYQDYCTMLLKDGGIKTKIVQRFIPDMNRAVNKYLNIFGLPVSFTLDETFSEKIKSPYKENYTYGSFSEGEKARIDLSIMFAWRELAKVRNSLNTNLIILDEVFNQSLEEEALEELIALLKSMQGDTSVFVITHLKSLHSKFDDSIRFEKVADFTRIAEES